VLIVVDPVKGKFRAGSWPYVCEKSLEAVAPSFADLDPTTTIAMIKIIIGVRASLQHSFPSAVFGRVG